MNTVTIMSGSSTTYSGREAITRTIKGDILRCTEHPDPLARTNVGDILIVVEPNTYDADNTYCLVCLSSGIMWGKSIDGYKFEKVVNTVQVTPK